MWGLEDFGLARVFKFPIQGCLTPGGNCRLDKIEVKKKLQNVEIPFGFLVLYLYDLARITALQGMGGKIPNVTHRMEICRDMRRYIWDYFVDLVGKVFRFCASFVFEDHLKTAAAKGGTRFRAVGKHETSL